MISFWIAWAAAGVSSSCSKRTLLASKSARSRIVSGKTRPGAPIAPSAAVKLFAAGGSRLNGHAHVAQDPCVLSRWVCARAGRRYGASQDLGDSRPAGNARVRESWFPALREALSRARYSVQ